MGAPLSTPLFNMMANGQASAAAMAQAVPGDQDVRYLRSGGLSPPTHKPPRPLDVLCKEEISLGWLSDGGQ